MTREELDKFAAKLSEHELAIAVTACKDAGAANAAGALSKHITRLQIELAWWQELAELRDKLLACYRVGRQPGDRLLDRLRQLREILQP